jgi:hypothetical protein
VPPALMCTMPTSILLTPVLLALAVLLISSIPEPLAAHLQTKTLGTTLMARSPGLSNVFCLLLLSNCLSSRSTVWRGVLEEGYVPLAGVPLHRSFGAFPMSGILVVTY